MQVNKADLQLIGGLHINAVNLPFDRNLILLICPLQAKDPKSFWYKAHIMETWLTQHCASKESSGHRCKSGQEPG